MGVRKKRKRRRDKDGRLISKKKRGPKKKPCLKKYQKRYQAKAYKRRMELLAEEGPRVAWMHYADLPIHTYYHFRMLCYRNGSSVRRTFIAMMQRVVIADRRKRFLENKYRDHR
jgi:hypothetical protein